MPFKNPTGLYALLALLPFIILYLRRPKPKEKTIPSLMFFMREKGITKFSNLFRQIFQNLLFLLQLAIILAAAFAAAYPYFTSEKAALARHTVIVLDASASMNALLQTGGQATRFSKAVENARLEGKVSIVLASSIPVVVLEKGSASEARKVLATLKAKAVETHVGDAMLAAGELAEDDAKGSKIVVLSDFQSNLGTDVLVAKRAIAAKGAQVELVNILGNLGSSLETLSNIGFVQLDVNKFQTTALVKNYGDVQRSVNIAIVSNNKKIAEKQLGIGPRSLESVSFDTMYGNTELKIAQDDDLDTDNSLFVSSPSKKVRVLLITNSDTSYLMAALKSLPNAELDIAFPPVVKQFNYDVIIIQNASSQLMLPGFYKEINRAVANGTGLVITATATAKEDLAMYIKQFSMPFEFSRSGNSSKASTVIENYLTNGIDFGIVASYKILKPNEGRENDFAALVAADDGSPLIGTYSSGNGLALYYGLFDDASTFRSSYYYPIFWDNTLSFLTKSQDLSSFNVLTGKVEGISEQQVNTPSGKVETARLLFDEAGFYTFNGKTVAANLLSDKESNIRSTEAFEIINDDSKLAISSQKATGEVLLERKLIVAALALLLIELLLIKIRGDL